MKNEKLYKWVVFIVVAAIVAIIAYSIGMNNIEEGRSSTILSKKVLDKTITEKVESLSVNTTSSDITLKKSDDEYYRVFISGQSVYEASAEVVNGLLNVVYDNSECKNNCSGDIIVYIPKALPDEVTIVNKNGDIEAMNLDTTSMDITLNNGDIRLGNIDNLEINNNNGDITVTNVLNGVNISENNGDIKINNFNCNVNSKIVTNLGDITIRKVNSVNVISTVSIGENRVNGADETSLIKLDIKTNLGSIRVN